MRGSRWLLCALVALAALVVGMLSGLRCGFQYAEPALPDVVWRLASDEMDVHSDEERELWDAPAGERLSWVTEGVIDRHLLVKRRRSPLLEVLVARDPSRDLIALFEYDGELAAPRGGIAAERDLVWIPYRMTRAPQRAGSR